MIRDSIWWIFDWFSRRAKRLRPQKRSASISVFSSAAAILCTKCSLQFKPTFMLLLNLFYHVKPSSHIPAAISDGMGWEQGFFFFISTYYVMVLIFSMDLFVKGTAKMMKCLVWLQIDTLAGLSNGKVSNLES